jgi:hypothetical protein
LVIILIYGGLCLCGFGHFAFNPIQFYREISNFVVVALALDNGHPYNMA